MTAALIIATILAAAGWFAHWAAVDQNRDIIAELNDTRAENARLRRQTVLLPGDTPIGDTAAAEVGLLADVVPLRGRAGGGRRG